MRYYAQDLVRQFGGQACKRQLMSLPLFHWVELSLMVPSNCSIFLSFNICANLVLFLFYLGYLVMHFHIILT